MLVDINQLVSAKRVASSLDLALELTIGLNSYEI